MSPVYMIAGAILVSTLIMGRPAFAATTGPQSLPPPSCDEPRSKVVPLLNPKVSVAIDPMSVWRSPGNDVKFTVNGVGLAADNIQIVTCFRWSNDHRYGDAWTPAGSLRVVSDGQPNALTFLTSMPNLGKAPSSWIQRILHPNTAPGSWTALALVPLAEFRVIAHYNSNGTWSAFDEAQPVGVTSATLALVTAIAFLLVAWAALNIFGRLRDVPGRGDPILQVISTRSGYASLSQLQILLWTFVVGGSAIYVMVLSGNLIDLTQGTLVLLGISGVAALGAKLQNPPSSQDATVSALPGSVVGLHVDETPGESDISLVWNAPTSGGQTDTYTIVYRIAGTTSWTTATSSLAGPGFRITGLNPATTYEIQVFAENSLGPGQAQGITAQTAASPAGAIGPISNFVASEPAGNTSLSFSWSPLSVPATYRVEYRRHDSHDGWNQARIVGCTSKLVSLDADTLYDVRVAAAAPTDHKFGLWTTINVATIGPRVPLWSDLVVDADGSNEIEVTRVQMLFFTGVVAVFVVMRVLVSDQIPEIPSGFIVLMGISNGVYLGNKFVSR